MDLFTDSPCAGAMCWCSRVGIVTGAAAGPQVSCTTNLARVQFGSQSYECKSVNYISRLLTVSDRFGFAARNIRNGPAPSSLQSPRRGFLLWHARAWTTDLVGLPCTSATRPLPRPHFRVMETHDSRNLATLLYANLKTWKSIGTSYFTPPPKKNLHLIAELKSLEDKEHRCSVCYFEK